MNKVTESQLKNSPTLLNQYYLQHYSAQMDRISSYEKASIFIEEGEEEQEAGVIDEAEEIEMERRQRQRD